MGEFDATKPGYYLTRDGRIALVAGYNSKAYRDCQVIGWLEDSTEWWYSNGKYDGADDIDDLVEYIGAELAMYEEDAP